MIEILRPLPISPVPDTPPWLLGLTLLRGQPTPVVDAMALGGSRAPTAPDDAVPGDAVPGDAAPYAGSSARFVSVRSGDRRIALAVGAVLGIRHLPPATPFPLLVDEQRGIFSSIDATQQRVLFVLSVTRLIPEALWRVLEAP